MNESGSTLILMQEIPSKDKDKEETETGDTYDNVRITPRQDRQHSRVKREPSRFEVILHRHRALVRGILHVIKLHYLVLIGSIYPIAFVLGVCYAGRKNVPDVWVGVYLFFGNVIIGAIVIGVMTGLYSYKEMKFLIPCSVALGIFFIAATIVVNIVVFLPFLAYVLVVIIYMIQMVWICIRFKYEKSWIFWGQAPIYLAIIFVTVNDMVIIPIYLRTDSFVLKSALSIFVYPIFFYVLVIVTQYCAEKLHTDKAYVFTMVAMAIKAFMGRVLNTQLHSYVNVVVASLLALAVRLAIKFFILYKHKLVEQIVCCGSYKDRAYLAPSIIIPQLLNTEKAMEIVAITFSCISIIFFEISRPNPDKDVIIRYLILLAIQYGIEICAEFLLIYIEIRHKISTKFKITDRFALFFPFSCAVGAALLATRIVGIYQVLNGESKIGETHY